MCLACRISEVDIYDSAKRSKIMASIKSKNTKPELLVFKYLRSQKVYFQRHYKRTLGSPDIALPRKKKAVFIHGDFWHGRTLRDLEERRGKGDFWVRKISGNVERDERQISGLTELGWKVLVIWESDLKRKSTREAVLRSVVDSLRNR